MKLTIFGTGYVGLVTGTCLAEVGHEVMCIDVDAQKIEKLKQGIIPIYEPGLEELVLRNYKEGRLHFSIDAKAGVEFADAIFSAVGTPPDENHKADLKYVKAVAETVGKYMNGYKVFINKSTVPVGTGKMCKEIIASELVARNLSSPDLLRKLPPSPKGTNRASSVSLMEGSRGIERSSREGHPGVDVTSVTEGAAIMRDEVKTEGTAMVGETLFDIVSNPEFLKEGVAVRDFMLPDRIVCGLESEPAKKVMEQIYKPFLRAERPIVFMSIESAEICKYASNAFLATKISFINEIANFAELVGANVGEIAKGMGLDERIGSRFLHAGIGYGGSCFPKDVQALIETGKEYDFDFQIISATEKVNEAQKTKVVEKLLAHFSNTSSHSTSHSKSSLFQKREGQLEGKIITLWGLSFKPKTDDIREAPSIAIIGELLALGAKEIRCFDPVSMPHMQKHFSGGTKVSFFENNYEALESSDALLIVTEWDMFRMADFVKIKTLMRGNIVIDGRNIWNGSELKDAGFIYEGIGK